MLDATRGLAPTSLRPGKYVEVEAECGPLLVEVAVEVTVQGL